MLQRKYFSFVFRLPFSIKIDVNFIMGSFIRQFVVGKPTAAGWGCLWLLILFLPTVGLTIPSRIFWACNDKCWIHSASTLWSGYLLHLKHVILSSCPVVIYTIKTKLSAHNTSLKGKSTASPRPFLHPWLVSLLKKKPTCGLSSCDVLTWLKCSVLSFWLHILFCSSKPELNYWSLLNSCLSWI